jgi:hypothetical protein
MTPSNGNAAGGQRLAAQKATQSRRGAEGLQALFGIELLLGGRFPPEFEFGARGEIGDAVILDVGMRPADAAAANVNRASYER